MIRDYQAIQKTWFPKGQQKVIPTFGKHSGCKLIGALDYETGEIIVTYESQYTAVEFLAFLRTIVNKYPGERIVLILDNARIHHAKLLQPFLDEHQDVLKLVFLPPYSPQLNLIEGLWGWVKSSVINNVFFRSVDEIGRAVREFINHLNERPWVSVDRLCLRI